MGLSLQSRPLKIAARNAAIFFVTATHVVEPRYPGAVEEIVNLGAHWNSDYLREHQAEIIELADRIQERFQVAARLLAEAGAAATPYPATDKQLLEQTANALAAEIFCTHTPQVRRCFSTALTNKGTVDLKDDLSRDYALRYRLVGAAAADCAHILEQLARKATQHGYAAELYHSGWQPAAAEMLLLPDLQIALLADDPAAPLPRRAQDRTISLGQEEAAAPPEPMLAQATAELSKAKALHDELEGYYRKAMDFEQVAESRRQLLNTIIELAREQKK